MPHPTTLLASLFASIFLAFGTSYMIAPRSTYAAFGLPNPSTATDLELMDRIMVMYGARDAFMGTALFASLKYGSKKCTGLILLAAGACAGVDGWVVKGATGEGEWNHWGYGSVILALGGYIVTVMG